MYCYDILNTYNCNVSMMSEMFAHCVTPRVSCVMFVPRFVTAFHTRNTIITNNHVEWILNELLRHRESVVLCLDSSLNPVITFQIRTTINGVYHARTSELGGVWPKA